MLLSLDIIAIILNILANFLFSNPIEIFLNLILYFISAIVVCVNIVFINN